MEGGGEGKESWKNNKTLVDQAHGRSSKANDPPKMDDQQRWMERPRGLRLREWVPS